ncbi:prolyl-tRNA synthetase [Candidatus Giovannonibacteria bacterium]|nr:prolyl-tRNA synthetase [Candidatus Giovannonibacteria bacterium]
MKQSQIFSKTIRDNPKDEESVNAKLLVRAGYVEKVMAGVYNFLPLGLRVFKKIENILRKEMNLLEGEEILLSALQPKENWLATGRWESYDTLFKFLSHYSKTEYVLGPTHEEIISPLAKKNIVSYRDLPRYLFQIQTKFRDEKRAKAGLLRGREFTMKDLYSFHSDEADLDEYYEKVQKAYEHIFEKAGIGDLTYLTFAFGGSFSKYSHEFQTLTPAGEDTIYICDTCKIAVNHEIIGEQDSCPKCGNKKLRKETAVEVGNIFKLKTKFSEPFGLKFKDENDQERNVLMGCYGIGLNRLMGTIVEIHHDENGIIWPESVAPFKAHLILIENSEGEIKKSADEIYNNLLADNIEVLYDDRDLSAGEKFADADLIGIPWRVVVSEKTLREGKLELKSRKKETGELISYDNFAKAIN